MEVHQVDDGPYEDDRRCKDVYFLVVIYCYVFIKVVVGFIDQF